MMELTHAQMRARVVSDQDQRVQLLTDLVAAMSEEQRISVLEVLTGEFAAIRGQSDDDLGLIATMALVAMVDAILRVDPEGGDDDADAV